MAENSLNITLIGAQGLQNALAQGGAFAKQQVSNAINKAANDIQQKAVAAAPHKTGRLWGSIHVQQSTPSTLKASVGSNLVYARAQEFGTQGMTINVPHGRETKKGSGKYTRPYTFKGNIKPKLYLTNARIAEVPKLTNYLQNAVNIIVNNIAAGART